MSAANVVWNENPKMNGQEVAYLGRTDYLRTAGWTNRVAIDCAEDSTKPTENSQKSSRV
jgi:hypothetical protein